MLFVIRPFKLFILFTTILLFFSTAYSKTSADFYQHGTQIPYFKNTSSLYPSGETSLDRLLENQIDKIAVDKTYYFYKNQKISQTLLKTTTAFDLSIVHCVLAVRCEWIQVLMRGRRGTS